MPSITGHNHARSASNRSRRLAERYLEALGLVAIQATAMTTGALKLQILYRITLKGEADRYWVKSHRDAEALLAEILGGGWDTCRTARGAIMINAEPDQARSIILAAATRRTIALATPADMTTSVERIVARAEQQMRIMVRNGQMKVLNAEYVALRTKQPCDIGCDIAGTSGTKVPPYSDWVDSRIAQSLIALSDMVQFTKL